VRIQKRRRQEGYRSGTEQGRSRGGYVREKKTGRIQDSNRAGQDTEKEQNRTGYRTGIDQKMTI
jgi:hypothetical protein